MSRLDPQVGVYLPASALTSVDRTRRRVALNVSKDAAGEVGWTEPPVGRGPETWGQGTLDEDPSGDDGPA